MENHKLTRADLREQTRQSYLKKAEELYSKHGVLNIIVLRVSTKDKGQQPENQLRPIVETFNLNQKECLLIKSKESAFKNHTKREFNIVLELFSMYEPVNLHIWSLDRAYRNRQLMVKLFNLAVECKGSIKSVREPIINNLFSVDGEDDEDKTMVRDMTLNIICNLFGRQAEKSSQDMGARWKKSLSIKNERTVTNKGNLVGAKLKYRNGKPIKDPIFLNRLEKSVYNRIKERMTYEQIRDLVRDRLDVSISLAYISKIKKKYSKNRHL